MRHARRLILITIPLLALLWLAWPFYEFYAHRDALPLGPFGWRELPGKVPVTQRLHDPAHAEAAARGTEILRRHHRRLHTPALSAAVAIDGRLVWAGAVGWSDIESGTPITPATRFRIGSTSKALTATALARLVEAGDIDLDTPIERYLEPLPNPAWASITPRQLASHMAGMPHYKQNTDWIGLYQTVSLQSHFEQVTDAVNVFDGSELLFEPGTDFHYSTLGTVLLGAVMADVADTSYRDLMHEQVFRPAGMPSTTVAPSTAAGAEDMAVSYKHSEGKFRPWRPVDLSHRLPGGGFASTSSDLARLGVTWLDDRFISRATRETFWTPQQLANGETNPQDYCLGWRVREYEVEGFGVVRNANHGGVSRGALSWLLVFPDYDMAIAFNTNSRTRSGEFHDFAMPTWKDLFKAFAENRADAQVEGSSSH